MIPEPVFSEAMFDALREVLNIGVGRAAHALAELSGREVSLQVLEIELLDPTQPRVLADLREPSTLRISQAFTGSLHGHALIAFDRSAAIRLAQLLLGRTGGIETFDELEQSALLELGNIVIGSVAGALASALNAPVRYELPQLQPCHGDTLKGLCSDLAELSEARVLVVHASLALRIDAINGYFALLFPEAGIRALVASLARVAP